MSAEASVALGAMRGRGLVYDPDLLEAFAAMVGADGARRILIEITLGQLQAGMMLADDVRSTTGALLIARGYTATDQLIERLRNIRSDSIRAADGAGGLDRALCRRLAPRLPAFGRGVVGWFAQFGWGR